MTSDENATPQTEAEEQINPAEAEQALEDKLALLEQDNAELREKMLRLAADMENLRKRTEREIADTRAYAISGFARDMLVATDNLSRALMVVPAEAREGAEGTLKSLLEGIDMTEREMQRLLAKHGVSLIAAQGEKFDPHRHQAMFEVPDASVAEGTIVQVVQEGYAIGERVLRPAMVGVAKGGPKRAPDGAGAPTPPPADDAAPEGVDKNA